jgi:hypothetical protein
MEPLRTHAVSAFSALILGPRLVATCYSPGSIGVRPAAMAPNHFGFFAQVTHYCSQPRYLRLLGGTAAVLAVLELVDYTGPAGSRPRWPIWKAIGLSALVLGESLWLTWAEADGSFTHNGESLYLTCAKAMGLRKSE